MIPELIEVQILRLQEVVKLTGLGRSTIYKMMKQGEFPPQIILTARRVGWRLKDIVVWLETRDQKLVAA